jgi:iron complex outermembrane receptor protein
MTPYRSRALLLGFTALSSAVIMAAPARAAAADAPAAAAPADNGAVGEVVVTGALRTEKLQDVPMAVTAVQATEFTNSGYQKPGDLQFLSPSVQVSIQGANAIYIRGSGTNSSNGGTEQSVGLVVDGVLIGFVDDIGGDLSDLDHVEVYRGPQGTQFAMNTTAGAVAIQTADPKIGSNELKVHGTYGEHNDTADYIVKNFAINDTLAARMMVSYQNHDGVFYNPSLQTNEGGRWLEGFRGKLLWAPDDKLRVLVAADVRDIKEFPNFPQAWGACGPGITEPYATIFGPTYVNGVKTAAGSLPGCNGATLGPLTESFAAALASPTGGAFAGLPGLNVNPKNGSSGEDESAYRNTDAGGGSIKATYQLGNYTLTSITAYRFMSRFLHGPLGSGYYTGGYLNTWYNGGQSSEELRLASPDTGKITFVGGLYFNDRDTMTRNVQLTQNYGEAYDEYPNTPYGQNVSITTTGGDQRVRNVNKNYAAFFDGAYHFNDKLLLNLGARITHDDVLAGINVIPYAQGYQGVYQATAVNGALYSPGVATISILPPRSLDVQHTGYNWRISPQYFITPDIQIYGTVAHGYKGPLIDTSVNVLDVVKPEEVNELETGLKSAWFGHKLTADITFFHEQYTNYQVSVLNQSVIPNVFQLGNAGGELSQGIELEINARVTDDLKLNLSASYNDSHYTDFITSCWNAFEPIKQAQGGPGSPNGTCISTVQVNPTTGAKTTVTSTQAAGTPLINSSRYTIRTGPTYRHVLAKNFLLEANAVYLWRSSWLSAPMDPNLVNPAYGQLNLDAGVTTPDGKYRLGVYARNALNTFYTGGRQAGNGGYTNVLNNEAVRTVGMSFDLKFQ